MKAQNRLLTPDPSKWLWQGHAAHFICASRCLFHLTTIVPGRYIVSTVGDYRPGMHFSTLGAIEPVGAEHFYETMVFRAEKITGCTSFSARSRMLDFAGYQTHLEANAGHLAMCMKWHGKRSRSK